MILSTDLLIADNNKIITAGGVSANQDLYMQAAYQKIWGHDVAIQTARCTLVNLSFREQAQYTTFYPDKNHGDENILKCQLYIENNLSKEIVVEKLCKKYSISQRALNRRFKQATGHSVINYIQQARVEKAKHILERENISFDELGYENASFFRKLLKNMWVRLPKIIDGIFFAVSK